MKKTITILLALCMLFLLFACNGSSGGNTQTPASPDTGGDSAPPPAPTGGSGGTTGWATDDVDHFSRDKYKIAYIVSFYVPVNATLSDMFKLWGEKMNFEYQLVDAQRDNDLFINSLEMLAGQGYDGFVLDFDPAFTERCFEICQDLGINWISGVNPVLIDGKLMWPGVTIDSLTMGHTMSQWLFDNYKNYWGDVNLSEVGIMICDNPGATDLHRRALGSEEKFNELLPEIAGTNMFMIDMGGMDTQVGYDKFTAIKSGNPQFNYWLVTSVVDLYAQGVVRAAEDLGVEDSTLVLCCDGNMILSEWGSGYSGTTWVGAIHVAPVYHSEPIICGLVAMIDGRATPQTLWADLKAPGADFAQVKIDLFVMTIDNYQQYLADADAYWNSIK